MEMKKDDHVILVDDADNVCGSGEKLATHKDGKLHRAFSVFIVNSENKLLLQKRAFNKYHSAGLWTNTCCSHPRPGEDVLLAAIRRLDEEMGMKNIVLKFAFKFKYKVELDNGFTEHELDHVFIGKSDQVPLINIEEVAEFGYFSFYEIDEMMKNDPAQFTFWFRLIFSDVQKYLV
jgi:isopentenyl-diphosphate Delta-isomerase